MFGWNFVQWKTKDKRKKQDQVVFWFRQGLRLAQSSWRDLECWERPLSTCKLSAYSAADDDYIFFFLRCYQIIHSCLLTHDSYYFIIGPSSTWYPLFFCFFYNNINFNIIIWWHYFYWDCLKGLQIFRVGLLYLIIFLNVFCAEHLATNLTLRTWRYY